MQTGNSSRETFLQTPWKAILMWDSLFPSLSKSFRWREWCSPTYSPRPTLMLASWSCHSRFFEPFSVSGCRGLPVGFILEPIPWIWTRSYYGQLTYWHRCALTAEHTLSWLIYALQLWTYEFHNMPVHLTFVTVSLTSVQLFLVPGISPKMHFCKVYFSFKVSTAHTED